MNTTYKIHPAIGIARVGNSPDEFYLSPEALAELPIACTANGTPLRKGKDKSYERVTAFKDAQQRIKKQAARFTIYVYDEQNPKGRPIQPGDEVIGVGSKGKLVDIEWTVWLANKKASWYQFDQLEGEHGYQPDHPLRNAHITDPDERTKLLIIDPGPQSINCTQKREAEFAKGKNPNYAQTFPPPLQPQSIDTLGKIMTNDQNELIVIGGNGHSGSYLSGPGEPKIEAYANNDGWFDDTSDGPVYAKLIFADERDNQYRYAAVEDPSWVVVGYPRYVPQIADMITLEDLLTDVNIQHFGTNQYLYGEAPFDGSKTVDTAKNLEDWRINPRKQWNDDYYPYFYRDVWPILQRPNQMQWVSNIVMASNLPHYAGPRGTFDESILSVPPKTEADPELRKRNDMYRKRIYNMLRQREERNIFRNTKNPKSQNYNYLLMPLLAGDNPISNTIPSKFLVLTETQLFILKQWAEGKFINEKLEHITPEPKPESEQLDGGVISNIIGGAFCPGGEVSWIMRNPAIYSKPFRIKADPRFIPGMDNSTAGTTPGVEAYYHPDSLSLGADYAEGLQPGDITRMSALPWQADFNECSSQDVNVTFQEWNKINPDDPKDPFLQKYQETFTVLWWPSHRPMQVFKVVKDQNGNPLMNGSNPVVNQVNWARGIPQTYEGDLKMVSYWSELGFVLQQGASYLEQERNFDDTISDQYAGPVSNTKKVKK
ncbi:LodA/GoxA family CTQ-dependent oxidase [Marinoscillum furvescens]|uniref:L-lysine 6-oxidase n=1 Tax=Marinoscillum furvescens DSM 4134 TaxID=1122208 RepID=A0A3D9L1F7_MARFU|nr:LodA/GoxA family CTQ-dependent oxidase [Marinoscillum furvescens]RED97888.1 hypothetical protein C7460_11129 [Marinoscillum furvescens DSM 4134]